MSIIYSKFIESIIDIHTLILIFLKSNESFHWTFRLKVMIRSSIPAINRFGIINCLFA